MASNSIQDIVDGRTKRLPYPTTTPTAKNKAEEAPFPTPEDSIHDSFDGHKSPTPAPQVSSMGEVDPPLFSNSYSPRANHYLTHTPQGSPPTPAWPHKHWPGAVLSPSPAPEENLTLPPINSPSANPPKADRPQPIEPSTYALPNMWKGIGQWNDYTRSTVAFNARYGVGPAAKRAVTEERLSALADAASLAEKQQTPSRNVTGPIRAQRKAVSKKRSSPIDPPAPRAQRARRRANVLVETDDAPIRRRQRTEKRDKAPHWRQIWNQMAKYLPPLDRLSRLEPSIEALRLLPANGYATKSSSLDDDPDRDILHPWEVELCERVRLSANLYMSLKLRIFEARYKRLGQNWSKTHAQAVGTVDVNKISTLWEVFHRVEWDRAEYFTEEAVRAREEAVLRQPIPTLVRDG